MSKREIDFIEFQNIAKDILKDIKKYCEDNNFRYYLAYGTLLGAVRHGDIIPWDYDIDIYMPRPDFERFIRQTAEKPINDHLKTYSYMSEKNYFFPFAKVCNTHTRLVQTVFKNTLPFGIWVDVFPHDAIPENDKTRAILEKKYKRYQSKALIPVLKVNTAKEKIYKSINMISFLIKKSDYYLKKASIIASKNDYNSAEIIGSLSIYAKPDREYVPKVYYDETVMISFGDDKYPCPKEYDKVLTKNYGDYMKLPPKEKRKIPNIKSFWID